MNIWTVVRWVELIIGCWLIARALITAVRSSSARDRENNIPMGWVGLGLAMPSLFELLFPSARGVADFLINWLGIGLIWVVIMRNLRGPPLIHPPGEG
ncbi:MAG: hypothetical protein ABJC19_11490 [Gemmatimonadota bacterium]